MANIKELNHLFNSVQFQKNWDDMLSECPAGGLHDEPSSDAPNETKFTVLYGPGNVSCLGKWALSML